MTSVNLIETFQKFVEACEEDDEIQIQELMKIFADSKSEFKVELTDSVEWEESVSDRYDEAPVVTQTFKVLFGDVLLYEGERMFGSELVRDRWEAIHLDDVDDGGAVIHALEELGVDVDWPTVPAWR